MCFQIDWASLIVGGKFAVFASVYFVFEGIISFLSASFRGAFIWRGDMTEGCLSLRFGGLLFEGAYFRNYTVFLTSSPWHGVLDKK